VVAAETKEMRVLPKSLKARKSASDTQRMFGEPVKNVEPGVYRHFTGELFSVLLTGLDIVTKQETVIYKSMGVVERIYVAPIGTFLSAVAVPGQREVPRFERINEAELEIAG
jgi:hypothetical protein